MTPTPTAETFEQWNEEMSKKYNPDRYHTSMNPLLRYIEGKRTKKLIRGLDIHATDRLLDIGCGAGNILETINAVRTGIDLSDTMLTLARARLGTAVRLEKMSAEKLLFPDASFDKVLCSEVIEHVLNPRAVLLEIQRVLAPGGIAAISIPNEDLIEKTKANLRAWGFGFLMANEGQTNLSEVVNEWHLHRGSKKVFSEWNAGILHTERVIPVPFPFLPFRYVFILKKAT